MILNKRLYCYYYVSIAIIVNYTLFTFLGIYYRTYILYTHVINSLYLTFVVTSNILIKQLSLNMLPAVIYSKKVRRQKIVKILRINPVKKEQLLFSFMIFLLYNIISGILIILQESVLMSFNLSFIMNKQPIPTTLFATIMFVLSGGIICPISEEFFFRGFLMKSMEKLGVHFSIFVSAFYFAIFHNNPYRLITLLLYGILVGYIVLYTDSILPGILFHILTNSIFVISSYIQTLSNNIEQNTYTSIMSGGLLESYYLLTLILVIVCFLCWLCMKKLKKLNNNYHKGIDTVDTEVRRSGKMLIVGTLLILSILFTVILI